MSFQELHLKLGAELIFNQTGTPQAVRKSDMSLEELDLKLGKRVICHSKSYTSNWGRVICHSNIYTSN